MQIVDILTADRIEVSPIGSGAIGDKTTALLRLAALLSRGPGAPSAREIAELLTKREEQQSTGVGGGVAIPHAAVEGIEHIVGALLLCPQAIAFEAVDGQPVNILFAVIGPKRGVGEHLKTLARVSRLLRDDRFRERLLAAEEGAAVFQLIAVEEGTAA